MQTRIDDLLTNLDLTALSTQNRTYRAITQTKLLILHESRH